MSAVIAVLSAIFAFAGLAGAALAVARTKGFQTSLQLMVAANAELRAENADVRRELQEEKLACTKVTSNLQGQIDALTGGLAERLLVAMGTAVANATKPSSDAATQAAHQILDTAAAAALVIATAKEAQT